MNKNKILKIRIAVSVTMACTTIALAYMVPNCYRIKIDSTTREEFDAKERELINISKQLPEDSAEMYKNKKSKVGGCVE